MNGTEDTADFNAVVSGRAICSLFQSVYDVERRMDMVKIQGETVIARTVEDGTPGRHGHGVTDYNRPTRLGSTTTMSTAEIRGAVTFEPDPAGTRMRWSWDLKPRASSSSWHRSSVG